MLIFYDLFKVGKMTILIMTFSKPAIWLMTCSKLAKRLIIMTCSKLAVLNKAIQDIIFKTQKDINYRFLFTWESVANRAIHDTFLSLKKVKKGI